MNVNWAAIAFGVSYALAFATMPTWGKPIVICVAFAFLYSKANR